METLKYPPCPVLIVDDEISALKSMDFTLKSMGINHNLLCGHASEVLNLMAGQEIEVLILDLIMPELSGTELLAQVSQEFPEVPVILVTGINDVDTAVESMRQGASDYIVKPVKRERLEPSVRRAIEVRALKREISVLSSRVLSDHLEHPEVFAAILTQNRSMQSLFQYVEAVAPGHGPVLITGETGVGKELLARAVHRASGRNGEFVAVNVAGLDETMFADTLFGHEKGAFTGADRSRPGLIVRAGAGTIFLDEIGDLSEQAQVKLLRLLQEREFMPLGADVARPTDARVVVATHRNLRVLRDQGEFRKDLYFRLKTHHLHIPPLRDRKDDLPLLLDRFLETSAQEFGKKKPNYHPELLSLLGAYDFPGNVRELQSMVHDAVGRHRSRIISMEAFRAHIGQETQPGEIGTASPDTALGIWRSCLRLPTIREATETLVEEAMHRADRNQRVAASILGISQPSLSRRLKRTTSE